jgi:hypothetical protein
MRTMRKLIYPIIQVLLLGACSKSVSTQAPVPDIPTLTATPLPLPINTPTATPAALQISGFPYAPSLNEELPKDGLVLAAHVFGDAACFDVGVYQDDSYLVLSCLSGFNYPAPSDVLESNEASDIHRWAGQYQGYEKPSVHGLLKFWGKGILIAGDTEKNLMEAILFALEVRAHP